jgi:hypothetical protein
MATRVLLPDTAKCVTNAILTQGNRIRQGWQDGNEFYETFHFPGALNFSQVIKLTTRPAWASKEN